jgi:hypothetical protein
MVANLRRVAESGDTGPLSDTVTGEPILGMTIDIWSTATSDHVASVSSRLRLTEAIRQNRLQ